MSRRKNNIRIGDQFGEWVVIGEATKPYHSLCRCSCGKVKEVNNSSLMLGKSLSCGHVPSEKLKNLSYKSSDIKFIGKRFGRLIVLKRVSENGPSKYLCRCDCGKELVVPSVYLTSGKVSSCGCLRQESSKNKMENIKDEGFKALDKLRVEGTSLANFKEKTSRNSTSGFKGVSLIKSSKRYRAYITLKGKQINLGIYDTAEEAYQARLEGEKKYFEPILDKYKDRLDK